MSRNLYRQAVGYLLLMTGALSSVWLGVAVVEGIDTHNWQETIAVVYRSNEKLVTIMPGDDEGLYNAEIEYRYQAEGTTHMSNGIYRADFPLMSRQRVTELVQKYPTGSIQKMYFNPSQPAQAVLIKGISNFVLASLLPAALFLWLGMRTVRQIR